ncbi:MAG: GAF domain-containing protein [Cyanobacteria bacterium P01_A01_bin.114]
MAQSTTSSMLATLSQANQTGRLTERVKDLPTSEFVQLLDGITREFKHFLKAIDLINNQSLEPMLEELLEAFTLKIGQILQAERTTIFIVDEDRQELWSKVAQGNGKDALEIRVPIDKGIAGYVASTGQRLNISDAYADPRFDARIDRKTGYRTRNILCMPVKSQGEKVVAVVQLLNKAGTESFTRQDEESFEEFASSIGVLLESCNSFYVAARNQKGVSALLKAISSLEQSLDLEVTLQSVMAEARDLMQADRSTLWLLSDNQQELWSKVKTADGQQLLDLRQPADKGIVGHVTQTVETLNIPDAYEDPRFDASADSKTGYRTRNILCMPVFDSKGKLIGVTQLINKAQGPFTNSDVSFMRAFNIQAGIALENATLFEAVLLEKQYQKDILQSLSNAVISTDMRGRVVTINEAALSLLGCPFEFGKAAAQVWEDNLLGAYVWDVIPIERLQIRLEDSLQFGSKMYVPEQTLAVGVVYQASRPGDSNGESAGAPPKPAAVDYKLGIAPPDRPETFYAWGNRSCPIDLDTAQVTRLEHSINLTVNPLTNPEGGVRGGLVVLEDISQEKRMKTTLYRYMTPSVAEQVMALGEDALMVGERKDVTVLFSDIRGYTTLTENLEASEVVSMLNEYFETMVEAVFNHEGTLDKFIGDALMAVFGAPLPLQNHAWSAVQSALDMRHRLFAFNRDRRTKGQPEIRIGIGLSSGEVVSGNIGSQRKMEYTVIGDGVNLSSRLEGITKQYGCDIVLSEHTYELCHDHIWVRELDVIRVKGKMQPVKIYGLIGDRGQALDENTLAFLDLYERARQSYTAMAFHEALQLFGQAQQMRPADRAVAIHLNRAQAYLQTPPPSNWDGVHVMTTK